MFRCGNSTEICFAFRNREVKREVFPVFEKEVSTYVDA